MNKYRIITQPNGWFKPQVKRWWWPFWCKLGDVSDGYCVWAYVTRDFAEAKQACIDHATPDVRHVPEVIPVEISKT